MGEDKFFVPWHEEEANDRHGYRWTGLFFIGDDRAKVAVRRDSYDHQSYARAEVWIDGRGWEFAHELFRPQVLQARVGGALVALRTAAAIDAEQLLRITQEILGYVGTDAPGTVPSFGDMTHDEKIEHLHGGHGVVSPGKAEFPYHHIEHETDGEHLMHRHRRRRPT